MLHEKSIFNDVFSFTFLSMCGTFMFVKLSNDTLTTDINDVSNAYCYSKHIVLMISVDS
jgi:hypothetical protein